MEFVEPTEDQGISNLTYILIFFTRSLDTLLLNDALCGSQPQAQKFLLTI